VAETAVKDVVIWVKHIHGADEVRQRIMALRGGETIELAVDGWRGPWVRMKDGRDGRPTPGIRPIGRTRAFWSELFASRRGDLVRLELPSASDGPPRPAGFREAARAALLRGLTGFRSDGPALPRDELHDRAQDRLGL
jgi:hypothetical protein